MLLSLIFRTAIPTSFIALMKLLSFFNGIGTMVCHSVIHYVNTVHFG